ncbi:MAG: VWA domain-containing protein [Chloroflexi bacterium]|nr:VWA domain-containing protein [Chloroflexota bacterium]
MTIAGWRFRDPEPLLLLALVLAIAILAVARERGRPGGLLFSSLSLLPNVRASWRVRLRWLLVPLRVLAATLLVLALARPQVGQAAIETVTQGIDIVLAIDTSSSMGGTDFGGRSKMDVTKKVVVEFLAGVKDHRIGVVVFSGEALVLSPLTLDYGAATKLVAPLQEGKLLRDGTAIGTGLAASVNVLRESQAPSRVIVLLTDGENNSGQIQPLDAANIARLLGIRVYTIGAVPSAAVRPGGSLPVDEQLMRRIAEMNGGQYFRVTDETAMAEVYRQIEQLEKTRVGVRRSTEYSDIYVLFLVPGAVLLILEMLAGATVFRRAP